MAQQFQSTPPRGRRLIPRVPNRPFSLISIHSAARAETLLFAWSFSLDVFQSTPPRGRRRWIDRAIGFIGQNFNPLRREGGDLLLWQFFSRDYSFQSTPPRGRRRDAGGQGEKERHISIHSAARAETVSQERRYRNANNFNPLRREGGDIPALKPLIILPISIHSAARAETVLFNHKRDYVADFNPLRREGGDNRLMSGRS